MDNTKIKELREKRQLIAIEMRTMNDAAEKAKRAFSAEESEKWNNLDEEIRGIDNSIDRETRLGQIGHAVPSDTRAASAANRESADRPDSGDGKVNESRAFKAWLQGRTNRLNEEERDYVATQLQNGETETRDFASGTNNVGGFTVPEGFYNKLEVAMKTFGGMLDVADVIHTESGNPIPMPTMNSTAAVATIISEGTAIGVDTSTPFGSVTLNAYMYAPPVLPVSIQYLQDGAFDESYIWRMQAEALARGMNAHFTTGTGTSQPQGIVTGAASGKVGTTGQTVSVIYDDLVDLVHSVDPVYRPMSKFMLHDTSVRNIRKLKDTAGRPIWLPGYESGIGVKQPDTLLGYEYSINQDMPVMAANAKSILYGRLDKYKIRLVKSVQVMRLVERYAEKLQVGFITFLRGDGRLLDAGGNPIKFYQNSAT